MAPVLNGEFLQYTPSFVSVSTALFLNKFCFKTNFCFKNWVMVVFVVSKFFCFQIAKEPESRRYDHKRWKLCGWINRLWMVWRQVINRCGYSPNTTGWLILLLLKAGYAVSIVTTSLTWGLVCACKFNVFLKHWKH